ncbi:glycine-rich cell wall structural protein 2-like [Phacochoerus africanus]|uniref:glycine-rich cell wall structural protein 2-like n=1 Tax=Phacochoerus africanus TaxID=41426 RepID=UPI001FDA9840|nr:glycine-rich cell wall structural protein 2-like [Phacochoerus africanus]
MPVLLTREGPEWYANRGWVGVTRAGGAGGIGAFGLRRAVGGSSRPPGGRGARRQRPGHQGLSGDFSRGEAAERPAGRAGAAPRRAVRGGWTRPLGVGGGGGSGSGSGGDGRTPGRAVTSRAARGAAIGSGGGGGGGGGPGSGPGGWGAGLGRPGHGRPRPPGQLRRGAAAGAFVSGADNKGAAEWLEPVSAALGAPGARGGAGGRRAGGSAGSRDAAGASVGLRVSPGPRASL